MKKETALLIKEEVSTKRLYTSVKEISDHHRIQVSQGYRDASSYVCSTLQKNGIEAHILSYPSDGDTWYLQSKMFLEWKLNSAFLELAEPMMKLADADEEPMSIIQRSYPCDFSDGAEVLFLDKGSDPEMYKDVDFSGKFVFTHDNFHRIEWTAERGALGYITDYIAADANRTRADLYHSLTYTSFWWKHTTEEKHVCGFVLSPCTGDRLEKIILARRKQGLITTVKGKVETVLEPGMMEVVEAVLPGTEKEEVLLTSHLCHPKSSCNDNASGCAANMEALRVLKKLMDEGKLPRNRRTIKAVFMPEFAGTFAYLSDHIDYEKMVGAMNLDMVGGKQSRAYGPITLTLLPYSTPSIIQPLSHMAMEMAGLEAISLNGDHIALTNHMTGPYTGGSDHVVYSHPDFNIPCCMLGQWPDRNYHTATDTLDVIDPEVLAFSTRTAANFAYTLADLKAEDIPEIMHYLRLEMTESFHSLFDSRMSAEMRSERLSFIGNFYRECVRSTEKLVPGIDITKEAVFVKDYEEMMRSYIGAEETEAKEGTDQRIFTRLFIGPLQSIEDNLAVINDRNVHELYAQTKKVCGARFRHICELLESYTDGTRTVGELQKVIGLEMKASCDPEVYSCLELYCAMGLMEEKEAAV